MSCKKLLIAWLSPTKGLRLILSRIDPSLIMELNYWQPGVKNFSCKVSETCQRLLDAKTWIWVRYAFYKLDWPEATLLLVRLSMDWPFFCVQSHRNQRKFPNFDSSQSSHCGSSCNWQRKTRLRHPQRLNDSSEKIQIHWKWYLSLSQTSPRRLELELLVCFCNQIILHSLHFFALVSEIIHKEASNFIIERDT